MSEFDEVKKVIDNSVEELEDGTFKVMCKDKTYILKEVNGSTFLKCRRLSERSKSVDFSSLLLMKSIVEPKISEMEFLDNIKASELLKLEAALSKIYGFDDFLQEEETKKQE